MHNPRLTMAGWPPAETGAQPVAGSRIVPEYSKEVHTVNKVRFEIKLSSCRDGRTLARIYDDYWDSMDVALFDPAHPEQVDLKAFKELAAQLANRKPGWYAIEVEDYPFGKAARLFRIPGRHLRYVRANGHSF